MALIEGDEARVNRFRKMADSAQPPLASVEKVLEEDYNGEIIAVQLDYDACGEKHTTHRQRIRSH